MLSVGLSAQPDQLRGRWGILLTEAGDMLFEKPGGFVAFSSSRFKRVVHTRFQPGEECRYHRKLADHLWSYFDGRDRVLSGCVCHFPECAKHWQAPALLCALMQSAAAPSLEIAIQENPAFGDELWDAVTHPLIFETVYTRYKEPLQLASIWSALTKSEHCNRDDAIDRYYLMLQGILDAEDDTTTLRGLLRLDTCASATTKWSAVVAEKQPAPAGAKDYWHQRQCNNGLWTTKHWSDAMALCRIQLSRDVVNKQHYTVWMAILFGDFCLSRSWFSDAQQLFERALEVLTQYGQQWSGPSDGEYPYGSPTQLKVDVLEKLANVYHYTLNYQKAYPLYTEALQMYSMGCVGQKEPPQSELPIDSVFICCGGCGLSRQSWWALTILKYAHCALISTPAVCKEFEEKGRCSKKGCKFSHDEADIAEARSRIEMASQLLQQANNVYRTDKERHQVPQNS